MYNKTIRAETFPLGKRVVIAIQGNFYAIFFI